jgi:ribonucleotide monophosphatase NagD (HAD superfamily)
LDTDILFAGNCGLQSLLVLSGFSNLDEVRRKQTSGATEDQKQTPMYYLSSLGDLVPMLDL